MTADRRMLILSFLEQFNRLERQNTDETGWIALKLSCTRAQAGKIIEQARAQQAKRKQVTS
jgi:hypothetical protein